MTGDTKTGTTGRKGAQGRRRSQQNMQALGVTAAGIALVEAVSALIDQRFAARRTMLTALEQRSSGIKLDTKALSKQLGGPTRLQGPDWHVVEAIAGVCLDEPVRRAHEVARLAGLFCVARQVRCPKGYVGEIIWPAEAGGAEHGAVPAAAVARLQQQVDDQARELDTLRRQVSSLAALAMAREADVQTLEAANTRLQQHSMASSVRALQRQAELDSALRAVAVHRRRTEALRIESATHTNRGLRERAARMAAQMERPIQQWRDGGLLGDITAGHLGGHPDNAGLAVDPSARSSWRALAAYLLIHHTYSGYGLNELAKAMELPIGHVHNMLTAQVLPSPRSLSILIEVLGADPAQAGHLFEVARGERPPQVRSAWGDPHVDHFYSVPALWSDGDPRITSPVPPDFPVASSFGDTDAPLTSTTSAEDDADIKSPMTGDTVVAEGAATASTPTQPGEQAVTARRERILRATVNEWLCGRWHSAVSGGGAWWDGRLRRAGTTGAMASRKTRTRG
jgi:hypothetical protein